MLGRIRRGFTLVELLVVIAILGVLVALIVPAVGRAREAARRAECVNNMRGLGQAFTLHQTSKETIPGRINSVMTNNGHPIFVTWCTKLLPYLDQNPVWERVLIDPINEGLTKADDPTRYETNLSFFQCPSDPPLGKTVGPLSYAMNSGIYDGAYPTATKNSDRDSIMNGIGHWLGVAPGERKNVIDMGQVSKNDGTSNTILVAENVDAVSWAYVAPNLNGGEESLNCIYWTPNDKWLDPTTSGNASQQQYGISKFKNNLPDDQLLQKAATNDPELIAYARPSSNHTQSVNVLYCDGHVDSLADDISYARYAQALSVSNTKSRHPKSNNGTAAVPVQLLQPTN